MKRQIAPRVLPNLLSNLIEVAVTDLEKVEKSRRYSIEMSVWHEPDPDTGHCDVCLAGSVIAFTLKEDHTKRVVSSSFDDATKNKLNALDYARCGAIDQALYVLKGEGALWAPATGGWPSVPSYSDGHDAFKAALREVATTLRERGL